MKKQKPRRPAQSRRPAPQPVHPRQPAPIGTEAILDTIMRLWLRPGIEIEDIAGTLGMTMPQLVVLLRTEEVTGLLQSLEQLAEQRHRLITLTIAPNAAACLDRVREEEETASEQTPITPQAIKADREARQQRTQRRLAATTVLNHLKALNAPRKAAGTAPILSDRCIKRFQTLEAQYETNAPQPIAA
jgi:DNA-binding MarR family transcriptional regulator